MENNTQIPEQNDVQQQINELKSKNDRLLHKYVELRTKSIAGDQWFFFILFGVFIALGIWGQLKLTIPWAVIIVIWMLSLCIALWYYTILQPLNSSHIMITPINDIRQELLTFGKNMRRFTLVLAPIWLLVTVWFALSFNNAIISNKLFLAQAILDDEDSIPGCIVSWFIMGFIMILAFIAVLLTGIINSNEANKIVAGIDEQK